MRRVIIVLLFTALVVSACSAGENPTNPSQAATPGPTTTETVAPPEHSAPTARPTQEATPEPTPTPAPTATPTPAPTPEPTPIPLEDRVPGSCGFLEEEYCGQGTEIKMRLHSSLRLGTSKIIAFHLPASTPIFSPISGAKMGSGIAYPDGTVIRSILVQRDAVAPSKIGDIKAEYIFFFAGASSKGGILAGSVPVSAGEILGVLTDEMLEPQFNTSEVKANLIILTS